MAEYSEVIPFFLMAGDKIVEAFYRRCDSDDGENWRVVEGIISRSQLPRRVKG